MSINPRTSQELAQRIVDTWLVLKDKKKYYSDQLDMLELLIAEGIEKYAKWEAKKR